jgi:hypothetical protein
MVYWWNVTDREKPKYLENKQSQHYFSNHKSHMD